FGLNSRTPARDFNLDEVKSLASELAGMRSPSNGNHQNALYRQNPEAWLESQVRSDIERVDASLWPSPIYGQVPAMLGGERGIIDLLAVDRSGRLCVLELKASE